MVNRFKVPLIILFVVSIVSLIVLVVYTVGDYAISMNSDGNETTIRTWNIGFLVMNNIQLIPFIIIPFAGLFMAIQYFIKTTLNKFVNSSRQLGFIETPLKEKPDFRNKLKAFGSSDVIVLLAIVILVPLTFYLIYYYPYKTVYTFNNKASDELKYYSYYLFPKKPKVKTYRFSSNDSILIHLWEPSVGGSDEPLPSGQVFIYYTETNYVKADQKTLALLTARLIKNNNISVNGKNQGLSLKMTDTIEYLSKQLSVESQLVDKPLMVPGYIQKRAELFTGSQGAAEKLGLLFYDLTGLKTVVNHMEGMNRKPVYHKHWPSKMKDRYSEPHDLEKM